MKIIELGIFMDSLIKEREWRGTRGSREPQKDGEEERRWSTNPGKHYTDNGSERDSRKGHRSAASLAGWPEKKNSTQYGDGILLAKVSRCVTNLNGGSGLFELAEGSVTKVIKKPPLIAN